MNGRLKRCRICRSAFLNIKDVFQNELRLDLFGLPKWHTKSNCRRARIVPPLVLRCGGAKFSYFAPTNRRTRLFAKKCGCSGEAFCFDCGFLCASFPPLRVLELGSQTSCHAIESL